MNQSCVPAYTLCQGIHLPGLAGSFRLTEAVVELHQQPLGKRLPCAIDASVVEHLGVLPADSHSISDAAVQVCALTLLSLKGHPSKRCAT